MIILKELWNDEGGFVVSSEAVLVSSIGILGVLVGLGTVSKSVDAELRDVAFAIRSLDQSYMVANHRSATGWSAGSMYVQQDVKQSLRDLQAQERELEERLRQQLREAGIDPASESKPGAAVKTPEPDKDANVNRKKNRKNKKVEEDDSEE